jgi:transposase-like protein
MFRDRKEKKLSDADKGALLALLREGRSVTYVANAHGVDRKTVALWRDRYEQTGHFKRKKKAQGQEESSLPKKIGEFAMRLGLSPLQPLKKLLVDLIFLFMFLF